MRTVRLYIAAGIFLLLTAVKLLFPEPLEELRAAAAVQINKNIDYRAELAALAHTAERCSGYVQSVWLEWAALEEQKRPEESPASADNMDEAVSAAATPVPESPKVQETAPSETAESTVSEQKAELPFEYMSPLAAISVSSGFGTRLHPTEGVEKFHYGLDLAADEGTEIRAFAAGTVAEAASMDGYGNYILLRHDDGYSSLYGHCSRLLVQPGEQVQAGQTIALVGHTGNATGPHLHFELREAESCIDPGIYLC